MDRKDMFTMSREELLRLEIIKRVLKKGLRQVEAAEHLELSARQVNRITRRVEKEGPRGVIHRLRGCKSNRKIPDAVREKALKLCGSKYEGFGPLLASEKLEELDGIKVSDETLRKWMLSDGKWERRRKRKKNRKWRERKARYGEMVQMDGSHHDWLEGRGPMLVLMGYIDDATGDVYARFYEYEGTVPALDSFKRYARKHGLPLIVYLDRHSTYKSNGKLTVEQELEGMKLMSQFERAMDELGVKVIHANSPQAKGRIERLFGTFQDRLIKEMRLKGIRTLDEANAFLERYLPVYNKRFRVPARESGDMHRELPAGLDINRVLCIKDDRTVRNDTTVSYDGKTYQLYGKVSRKRVAVEQGLDGRIRFYDGGNRLKHKEIPCRTQMAWHRQEKEHRVAKKRSVMLKDYAAQRRWLFGNGAAAPTSTSNY